MPYLQQIAYDFLDVCLAFVRDVEVCTSLLRCNKNLFANSGKKNTAKISSQSFINKTFDYMFMYINND